MSNIMNELKILIIKVNLLISLYNSVSFHIYIYNSVSYTYITTYVSIGAYTFSLSFCGNDTSHHY